MSGSTQNSLRLGAVVLLAVAIWAAVQIARAPTGLKLAEQRPDRQVENTTTATAAATHPPPIPATVNERSVTAARYWPQWRGPLNTGVAPHAEPPVEWSETLNIRWKVALPGKGHSTPVIWDDRVFVSTAEPYGEMSPPTFSGEPGAHTEIPVSQRHKFIVMAISRADGRVLWKRTLREQLPHAGGHSTASLASGSPVTDGEHVFAFFGSYGLYGLSLDGKLIWEKDLGPMHPLHGHGEGSSAALYQDTLIVNWDHEGPSFLMAFDKRTGQQRWKVRREHASSWSTPIVVEQGGGAQVIVSGSQRVRAYDLSTGEAIWECGGLSAENVVASPVAGDGLVYVGSTYDSSSILAIRLDGAKGDITGTRQVAWRRTKGAPYVPSPLLYGDSLYVIQHFQGILTRIVAQTGDPVYDPVRLPDIYNVFASPVAAANRVYVTSREGVTVVLKHGSTPEVLALNRLDDSFSASAALAGNELLLRGEQFLYCIAKD